MSKMDDQIAMDIMGWTNTTPAGNLSPGRWYGWVARPSGTELSYLMKRTHFKPTYSYDHAMKVARKIGEMSKNVQYIFEEELSKKSIYTLTPLDICQAALKAIEERE